MSHNQLPTTPPHDDCQWRVERYVLEDPTLDRQAFEASMAEDIELALAVADCVEQLQGLSQACRCRSTFAASLPATASRPDTARLASSVRASKIRCWALATVGLAATLLVASVALFSSQSPRETTAMSQRDGERNGEQRLAEVAQQWLVMNALPTDHDWLPTETSRLLNELAASEINEPNVVRAEFEAHAQASMQANMTDDNDWMLQVSAAFFQESES